MAEFWRGWSIPERQPKVADDEEAAYSGDRVVSRVCIPEAPSLPFQLSWEDGVDPVYGLRGNWSPSSLRRRSGTGAWHH
jgi:hypothetical protein